MVKPSELRTANEIHEQSLQDPDYRAESERTQFANDVAVTMIKYRTDHHLTQKELADKAGMRQPHVARLEAADHEPKLSTLQRLSSALGLEFRVDIKPNAMRLRAIRGIRTPGTAKRAPVRRVPVGQGSLVKVRASAKSESDRKRS